MIELNTANDVPPYNPEQDVRAALAQLSVALTRAQREDFRPQLHAIQILVEKDAAALIELAYPQPIAAATGAAG